MRGLSMKRAVLALSALVAAGQCLAGATGGVFGVNITLAQPGAPAPSTGVCVNQPPISGSTVKVVCQYLGLPGGTFTYYFSPSLYQVPGSTEPFIGAGTITTGRIYSVRELDGPIELLVSY